jgi:hypothetical protein
VLNNHAPVKKKVVRANDMPYMTKQHRKAIMKGSALARKSIIIQKVWKTNKIIKNNGIIVTGYIKGKKELV